ncbi:MAG: hypothetical protein ACT4QA_23560 [Panacagrimonas sp.]
MNRDDDFFRLPKARNPLRPQADAAKPTEPAAANRATTDPVERMTPVVSPSSSQPLNPLRRQPAPVTTSASTPKPVSSQASNPAPQATASEPPAPPPAPPAPPPPPAQPRPPSGRKLWLWPVFGVGIVGIVIVGGLTGYWLFMNLAARLTISDQPLTIRLPDQTDIVLRTQNKIDVLMQGTIHAQVPLNQTLRLPVKGSYLTEIDINTTVPLETVIIYEGIIPIDSIADIEAKAPVNFQNVKKYKNLHFKAKLPMKLSLPVKLVVPVKQDIRVRYKGPLKVTIDHVINTPVNTTLRTALKVNQQFSVPITSSLPARLNLPQHPVKATIVEADLFLNLSTLRLEHKDRAAAAPPTRSQTTP